MNVIQVSLPAMGSAFMALLRKDLIMEWRQKHTLFGVLVYVGAIVFVVYMMNGQPDAKVWNALFWTSQLFVAVNSMAKSFLQEHPHRFRYYYTIARPVTFLLAKLAYSTLLMIMMTLVSLLLYALMLGWPPVQGGLFILISVTGSLSLAVVFTFLSAIAARTQQNSSLMAILGFPLVTPLLMILSKLASAALQPVYIPGWWSLTGILLLLDVLIVALGVVLFPFLWQE
ncbi:heme exporter protein CcmB [Nemorincola caseinilytica]